MFVLSVRYKGHERSLLASDIEFESTSMTAQICDRALSFPLADVLSVTQVDTAAPSEVGQRPVTATSSWHH
ncbi:hypothetical protein [Rhizobium halophytocola]|uniref:L-fucose mutarotase/ribose pyranase (RbsD/FucU family) n=1 Tax=Rhizobium halophytocola TaxID=735519 RepID=A0ABS4DSI1_9HYPH|nr:hypothetical protein [Rhizobium halophytocola]MBP1848646.1 L-fucose mutarotase/ribose pyranase (RbsD/FucU family) [Rhizobium halophytocola]